MSRAERWWRPTPSTRRPAQRSRIAGRRHADKQVDDVFDIGYAAGYADAQERTRQRDEQITRLASAADAAANGDPSLLEELSRQAAGDDLLDVADAAGATPLAHVDGGQLVDELEAWLRGDAQ
ncbi:hypothetical protein ACIA47_23610 [Micromonospora sp. NPDC051227]|uniref:hypothetical protein n=1 Tax=Micromonospora sp. NPDC051227 TaxID=3364285 RepID=UPI0037A7C2AE